MKQSRFAGDQVALVPEERQAWIATAELSRKHGMSDSGG